MKKILFSLLLACVTLIAGAQTLKGDLTGDGVLNNADATHLVNLILGTEDKANIENSTGVPYCIDNSFIEGTWYKSRFSTITFDSNGYVDSYFAGIPVRYEFMPYQGCALIYDTDGVTPYTRLNVLEITDNWLLVNEMGSNRAYYLTKQQPTAKVTSIMLNTYNLHLAPGSQYVPHVTILPSYAEDKGLQWESSNTSVATVSASGRITAVSPGSCTITCRATDGSGVKAEIFLLVSTQGTKTVSGIAPVLTHIDMAINEDRHISVSISPADASTPELEWTTSNPYVATVSDNGTIHGVGSGTCDVTCRSTDGSDICVIITVSVEYVKIGGMQLNPSTLELGPGDVVQLNAIVTPANASNLNFNWSSSNISVATVSTDGKVSAKSLGTCIITCSATDGSGKTGTCSVTVSQSAHKVKTIELSETSLVMNKNSTHQLTAQVGPADATNKNLSWESSDLNIATVSSSGKVTTKNRQGSCLITCRATDNGGASAHCRINVTDTSTSTDANGNTIHSFNNINNVTGVTLKMVEVKGGTYTMGVTPELAADATANEQAAHLVTVGDFSIGTTEVTVELWNAVMGTSGSGSQLPVTRVSTSQIEAFILRLNEITGLNFRLPTEEEWEYAARGGQKTHNYKYAGSNNLDDVAWYKGNSSGRAHTVAQKLPNELGLYDMSGNVFEITAELNERSASYNSDAIYQRISYRVPIGTSYGGTQFIGFRLAL